MKWIINVEITCSSKNSILFLTPYIKVTSVKRFFCHNIVFNVQWIKVFVWRKNSNLFSSYLDFCVFHESTNFKNYDVIIDITVYQKYVLLFLLNVSLGVLYSLFFNEVAGVVCNFIKKEALTQVFFCECYKIFKNFFFSRTSLDDWF